MDKGKQEGPSRQDTPVPRRRCERLGSVELNVFVKVREYRMGCAEKVVKLILQTRSI